jgi:hypothetical protein
MADVYQYIYASCACSAGKGAVPNKKPVLPDSDQVQMLNHTLTSHGIAAGGGIYFQVRSLRSEL